VIRQALAGAQARLDNNEAGVIEGREPEAIHGARVATRRLRSDLRTFEPFLDARAAALLRGELRWLTADLGAVRDIEVLQDRLRKHARQLPEAEAAAVTPILRRLDADRVAARETLLAAMRSSAYRELRAHVAAAASDPPYARDGKGEHGRRALAKVVRKRWKKLRKAVERAGDNPSDDVLHAIRIRAKRARYAAEACVPVFGKDARRFARAMTEIQDTLGEHHDAVVAGTWLAKTAHEVSPGEAYALGRLGEIEYQASLQARREFSRVWKRARRKRLRRWLA
jgi:CHAD domain-containing protein